MGTRLSFNYTKSIGSKVKRAFEEPFYCKEMPSEVLQRLISKYHVIQYNTITTNLCDMVRISSSEDNYISPGKSVRGLIIVPYNNEKNGLTISGSVNDFSPGVPESDLSIRNAQMIVDGMITKFLVDVKVLDFGSIANMSDKIISYGKQNVTNYLRTRNDKKDLLKEQHLEDILIYGKIVIGSSFNEEYIKKIADKVVKSTPKKFDPHYGLNDPRTFH